VKTNDVAAIRHHEESLSRAEFALAANAAEFDALSSFKRMPLDDCCRMTRTQNPGRVRN
jgi:hypothetical protein